MAAALTRHGVDDLLADFTQPGAAGTASMWWLGQAGFLVRHRGLRLALDPYLSDSLARKYAGRRFAHQRLMPAPVRPEDLTMLDLVLCTHGHTDHMDGDTLRAIAAHNPHCRFVVPAAERDKALDRGVPAGRLVGVCAGDEIAIGPDAHCAVVPAAHEERQRDAEGRDLFLGYVLKLGARRLYHPGDCVPFEGQQAWLDPHGVELALMPVNGRDAFRRANGVPGNFHLGEALDLCCAGGIAHLLGHHYGMFEFNTVEPEASAREIAQRGAPVDAALAQIGLRYDLAP